MKLQALLDKHKDKLWWWHSYAIIFYEETNTIDYIYYQENWEQKYVEKYLSDLLFNTPFLSLLDFKSVDADIAEYQYDDDWVPISIIKTLTTSEYHKINLALLPDDKSRVEYIEDFTL